MISDSQEDSDAHRSLTNPLVSLSGAAFLLAAGILASYFLGRASVRGVIAAGLLLIVTVVTAAAIGFSATRQVLLPALRKEFLALGSHTHDLVETVLASITGMDRWMTAFVGASPSSTHPSLLTDTQYAALEAASSTKAVVIAIREMGKEFQDDIADRDAFVDYGNVVLQNVRHGVTYTYITEESVLNASRARQAARKLGDLGSNVRVLQIPREHWEKLPFPVETVFIRRVDESLDAFLLLPNGASKEDRTWVRLSEDYRDRWWAVAEEMLARAQALSNVSG
jgi:hypothetical protein